MDIIYLRPAIFNIRLHGNKKKKRTPMDDLIKMQGLGNRNEWTSSAMIVMLPRCPPGKLRYTQSFPAAWMACELCVPDDRVHEFLVDIEQCLGHPLLIKAPDSAGGNRQQQKQHPPPATQ